MRFDRRRQFAETRLEQRGMCRIEHRVISAIAGPFDITRVQQNASAGEGAFGFREVSRGKVEVAQRRTPSLRIFRTR